ncbi:MAG: exodeoxyribonuclease VII small subunit [Methylococcales bacterium]|jgi:exodeoxyribonuclease VII small subunit|nr:exodeoxyribonuclease VII small subunit [Methylococcales bacterium]MBT7409278.1 exodeoxyribonuclease VII small subunit [Methylococcales bacterium]
MSAKKEKISFENAFEELENLIIQMEQGNLSLDQSLKNFERGIELTRFCQKELQDAEQKVQILSTKETQENTLISYDTNNT